MQKVSSGNNLISITRIKQKKRYILNIGWILTHILGFRTDFLSRKYDTKEIIMNEFIFSPIGNLPSFPFTLLQLSILMSNTSY